MAPERNDLEENESDAAETSTISIELVPETDKDPYFPPVVSLPKVKVVTCEEDETELLKLRCKLFRFFIVDDAPEWKERGTGYVKILQHNDNKKIRLVMRQEKTLKVRANHYISPYMELKKNCNNERILNWSVNADFADEELKQETFAIKFANADEANKFKDKFDFSRGIVTKNLVKEIEDKENKESGDEPDIIKEAEKSISHLNIKDEQKSD